MFRKFVSLIFFGNYFYAACSVALAIEAGVQMNIALNPPLFYLLLAAGTIVYYTRAYVTESTAATNNPRTKWYQQHTSHAKFSQLILTVFVIGGGIFYAAKYYKGLFSLSVVNWMGILSVPVAALLYYGLSWHNIFRFKLRQNGWLKPFVIGFVWAGTVTIYPIIFKAVQTQSAYPVSFFSAWLFIKNWMFITVLCIMFDIKDYATDHNQQLKTFVVRTGLRKTIFLIIIPLTIAGWLAFLIFSKYNHFPVFRVAVNSIPFILLLMTAYSMHRRKSILYYLIIIDGLMIVKAACGILGTLITQ